MVPTPFRPWPSSTPPPSRTFHPLLKPKDFPGFSKRDLRNFERYYSSQLELHKSPEKKVGWQTAESQRLRFEALAAVAPLEKTEILDVGCGLGGFWSYLKSRKIRADYTGVDLFPRVIREARQIHPEVRFEVRSILGRPFRARSFDYSFLSGVFNVRVRDNWKYMREILTAVLKQSRKAVAFNVLNSEAGLKEPDRFFVSPRALAALGSRLGVSRVQLLDHYHPMDLTLFLYK